MFDESLNHHLQDEQMDMHVRFWNNDIAQVQTRYLESRFFKRPNAEKIHEELLSGMSLLPTKNMTMLSMDGPHTNWKVLDLLKNYRDHNEFPQVLDVGSCGLHIVHGAFQTGVKASGWNIDKLLKAMWRFFIDSPARRDLYIQMNKTDLFPLMFCQTRWVEDEPVASRALSVWEYVVTVIKHFQTLTSSKQPKNNKSYDVLVQFHKDNTMILKFQFFKDIANILSAYLKQFQTDKPVMPFVSDVLEQTCRRLMRMFLRRSVVDEAFTHGNRC